MKFQQETLLQQKWQISMNNHAIYFCIIIPLLQNSGKHLGSCILQCTLTDTLTDASVDILIVTRSTLDRHATNMSIDCRLRVGRCFGRTSTDVGRGIDRDHIGSLSVNYRRDIGQPSAECRSCSIRQLILSVIIDTIDRYLILSTDYRPMYWQIYLPILEHLSTGCGSVECRPMYQPIYRPISTNTLGEGKVSVKHRCSIGEVSVKYR